MCPHNCKVNRAIREYGKCYSGYLPIVSSYTPHFGEEPVLTGSNGVGNIFFGNCNLRCTYCQNHEISQNRVQELSHETTIERLAEIMLELQQAGCHSIGLVSPTHFAVQILEALLLAAEAGLTIPLIYNTNGYDSIAMLELFAGVIDIYLPDFKYGDNISGTELSNAPDYFSHASAAITEMHRQIGNTFLLEEGLLKRGIIIRHLILPNGFSETETVFRFIAQSLSTDLHISLMSQYYPAFKANNNILLSRKIRVGEYEKALSLLERYGLKNGWIQELESPDLYRPYFADSRTDPFRNGE